VRVLERESGTPADELGAGFYMHSRYDPHPTLKAALAGEPIPPAPDEGGRITVPMGTVSEQGPPREGRPFLLVSREVPQPSIAR
jgi:hypothetical protein